jgi:hypothetical protein
MFYLKLVLISFLGFSSITLLSQNDKISKCDRIIKKSKLYSVMHKAQSPPSGDKHDYMSQGPYWWPDSSKSNGLPYIRKDGYRNPEIKQISDSDEMDEMIDDVVVLTEAFEQTGQEKYASFASKLLTNWFLDSKTKQNPNLNFGQGIPGINTGRGIGIIETRFLFRITHAAARLLKSKSWSQHHHKQLQAWFSDYLTWLLNSPIGKDEADELNNHGTYYDVQVVDFALFVGKKDLARQQLEVTKRRIQSQIMANGSQPNELKRTKSLGYSLMNLDGLFYLAQFAEKLNINLWEYQTAEGAGLRKAFEFLQPYLKDPKSWPFEQIAPVELDVIERFTKNAQYYLKSL